MTQSDLTDFSSNDESEDPSKSSPDTQQTDEHPSSESGPNPNEDSTESPSSTDVGGNQIESIDKMPDGIAATMKLLRENEYNCPWCLNVSADEFYYTPHADLIACVNDCRIPIGAEWYVNGTNITYPSEKHRQT